MPVSNEQLDDVEKLAKLSKDCDLFNDIASDAILTLVEAWRSYGKHDLDEATFLSDVEMIASAMKSIAREGLGVEATQDPLSVKCPKKFCWAPPGEQCNNLGTKQYQKHKTDKPHQERRELAKRLTSE